MVPRGKLSPALRAALLTRQRDWKQIAMTLRSARRRSIAGLSVAEVLVIAMAIATLAAVVLPLYLGEGRAARDVATEADAFDLETFILAAFEEGDGVSSVATDGEWYTINGEEVLERSPGVELVRFTGDSAETWCLELRHPDGDRSNEPGVSLHAGQDEVEYAPCS